LLVLFTWLIFFFSFCSPFHLLSFCLVLLPHTPLRLQEYCFSDCAIWYIRFALDAPHLRYLAVGNKSGSIFVWGLDDPPGTPPRKLSTPNSQRAVRCVAFSSDARVIVAACEDGSIFRWDQMQPNATATETKQNGATVAAAAQQ